MQLQELQVRPPQQGMVATYGAMGTSAMSSYYGPKMANTVVLSDGALTTDNTEDKVAVG